jgi:hypothetical protein
MERPVSTKGAGYQFIAVSPPVVPLVPLMNDTKWAELREAMLEIEPTPRWSAVCAPTGWRSDPDMEWYYHFRQGPYSEYLSVDVLIAGPAQRDQVRAALRKIHLPGEEIEQGFRILGYAPEGQAVGYI